MSSVVYKPFNIYRAFKNATRLYPFLWGVMEQDEKILIDRNKEEVIDRSTPVNNSLLTGSLYNVGACTHGWGVGLGVLVQ